MIAGTGTRVGGSFYTGGGMADMSGSDGTFANGGRRIGGMHGSGGTWANGQMSPSSGSGSMLFVRGYGGGPFGTSPSPAGKQGGFGGSGEQPGTSIHANPVFCNIGSA